MLVPSTGIDPVLRVPQTRVLPLHQDGKILEHREGIEPSSPGWKPGIITTILPMQVHFSTFSITDT